MAESYYGRLGVASDASVAEIKRAYRERLKETHPDVSDDADAEAETRALIEARDVLTDETERARYDRLGHERYVEYHDSFVEPTEDDVSAADPQESHGDGGVEDEGGWNTGGRSTGDRNAGGWNTGGWNTGDRGTDRRAEAATGGSQRRQRRAQNEQTRAAWNATGQHGTRAGTGDDGHGIDGGHGVHGGHATGESYAREWHAWDTGSPHRVHPTDSSTLGNRLYPPGPSLVLLATAFAVYPIILWATVTPRFPLSVNLVVGLCLLGLVAYLQSMPGVGVVVFGAWTLLLPAVLVLGLGVPVRSPILIVSVGGTALPLGLSILTWTVMR